MIQNVLSQTLYIVYYQPSAVVIHKTGAPYLNLLQTVKVFDVCLRAFVIRSVL